MTLTDLLDRMFPGEAARGLPPFTQACPHFAAALPRRCWRTKPRLVPTMSMPA